VGFIACGGYHGERLERAPAEMKKYGAEEIVLASCFLAGYPPSPYLEDFIQYIEKYVGISVVVVSHHMPTNYINARLVAKDWDKNCVQRYLQPLVDDHEASLRYDSTKPESRISQKLKHSRADGFFWKCPFNDLAHPELVQIDMREK
jgi:hypothetical protein